MDHISSTLDELNLDQVTQEINGLFDYQTLSLKDVVINVIAGEGTDTINQLVLYVKSSLLSELGDFKTIFATILLLGVLSAVFSEFGKLFENRQISDLSYYLIYLMMIMILLQITEQGIAITTQTLEAISDFSKILIPTYCLSIGLASGTATSIAFYEVALVIIYAIEKLLLVLIIPIIYAYVFLAVMNGIGRDGRLDGVIKVMNKGICMLLKLVLTLISCFGVLQAMITPVIDSVKTNSIQKLVAMIPGIGAYLNTATEVVYGSAVLVKNAIGIAGIIMLMVLCATPLIKLALITISLKLAGAVAGIVADQRMNRSIEQVAEGSGMLLRTAATAVALFVITIAVIAVTTNRGF